MSPEPYVLSCEGSAGLEKRWALGTTMRRHKKLSLLRGNASACVITVVENNKDIMKITVHGKLNNYFPFHASRLLQKSGLTRKNSHFTFHGKKGPITFHDNTLYHPQPSEFVVVPIMFVKVKEVFQLTFYQFNVRVTVFEYIFWFLKDTFIPEGRRRRAYKGNIYYCKI